MLLCSRVCRKSQRFPACSRNSESQFAKIAVSAHSVLSLFSSLSCQTPFARLLLRQGEAVFFEQPPEFPSTDDPSTQGSHPDHGRVFTTAATFKIKHFRRGGAHSNGKHMFLAMVADSQTAALKTLTSLNKEVRPFFPKRQ